jgi:hypothetical protein
MVIAVLIAASLVLAQFWYDARHSRDPISQRFHEPEGSPAIQTTNAVSK